MTQWDKFMVDLCTDAMAAEECMNLECKVERRTTCWHRLNLSLWCKDKDFRCKKVEFDGIEKVHGVWLWVIKNLLYRSKPFVQFTLIFSNLSTIFIFPMCSKALFSQFVHVFRTYLYFNPTTFARH